MRVFDRHALGRFAYKLAIFVLPFALAVLIALGLGAYLGEVLPMSRVIEVQQADERLIFYPSGERDAFLDYKLATTLYLRPDVLFLGSSRLQFARISLITNESLETYNASIVGLRVEEMYDFVLRLSEENALPQLLIINLDFPDFNGNSIAFRRDRAYFGKLDLASESQRLLGASRLSLRTFFAEPASFMGYSEARFLERGMVGFGIEAIQQRMGYRQDGSFFRNYGRGRNGVEANLRWIANGQENYEYGRSLDTQALETLDALLDFVQEKNIELVAVLSPYHPEIYAAMDFSDEYSYIPQAQNAIAATFSEHDFPLFDFTEPSSIPSPSDDFFDGWHVAETGSLRMWMQMLRLRPEILGTYADMSQLEALLLASDRFYLP